MDNAMTMTTGRPKSLGNETSADIHDHFPFDSERPTQTQALDRIAAWLHGPKKFFILEGPTGFGKSGVGMAAASYAKTVPSFGGFEQGAYILSPQISLTGQYMADFAKNGLVELKGQSNYHCSKFDMDCEAASLIFDEMHNSGTCTGYKPAKERFMQSLLGVCNFAYYLAETTTAHQLADRTLLVVDEGHNCEDQILSFTDTEITQNKCDEYAAGKLPLFNEGDTLNVRQWLDKVFVPAVQAKYLEYQRDLRKAKERGNSEERAKIARRIVSTEKYLQRIALFTNADEPGEWFAWSDWNFEKKQGTGNLVIKPLTARLFADDIMFSKAQKVLIMSATILDFGTFMRNLGIDPRDAEILAVDSEFPLEHRPIYYKPVANMRAQDIKHSLPLVAQEVRALMGKYAAHKGIVHTQSFSNNKYITDFLKVEGFGDRVMTHQQGGPKGSREGVIERHKAAGTPTVLFSPSMAEGLDLKEDLARWGVIIKVPYAALDPYVKARSQKDPDWYLWLTALKLVQQTGRIVRSSKDKGVMWILDAGFGDFLRRAKSKMPKWWRDSIIDLSKFS
jgi:ATP-dependent DNA helicase DinG